MYKTVGLQCFEAALKQLLNTHLRADGFLYYIILFILLIEINLSSARVELFQASL